MCIYILQAVLFRPSGPHQCSADIVYMTLNSANYQPLEVDRLQFFSRGYLTRRSCSIEWTTTSSVMKGAPSLRRVLYLLHMEESCSVSRIIFCCPDQVLKKASTFRFSKIVSNWNLRVTLAKGNGKFFFCSFGNPSTPGIRRHKSHLKLKKRYLRRKLFTYQHCLRKSQLWE